VQFSNLSFSGFKYPGTEVTSSFILDISAFSLQNVLMENIIYEFSELSFLSFAGFESSNASKSFQMQNVNF